MQSVVLGAGENATQLNQAVFQSLAAFQDITFPAATCLFPKQPTCLCDNINSWLYYHS